MVIRISIADLYVVHRDLFKVLPITALSALVVHL